MISNVNFYSLEEAVSSRGVLGYFALFRVEDGIKCICNHDSMPFDLIYSIVERLKNDGYTKQNIKELLFSGFYEKVDIKELNYV